MSLIEDGVLELDDLLLTEAVWLPDMNLSDFQRECQLMMERNRAIQQFYQHLKEGTLTLGFNEYFADLMAESEVDPYVWLDHTQQQVHILLDNDGIPYTV